MRTSIAFAWSLVVLAISAQADSGSCVKSYGSLGISAQARAYNEIIQQPVSEIPQGALLKTLNTAVDKFSENESWFPAEKFKQFLEREDGSALESNLEKLRSQKLTVGDLLRYEFQEYYPIEARVKDQAKLRSAIGAFTRDPEAALKTPSKWDELFKDTCLSRMPASMKNLVSDFTLSTTAFSYIQYKKDHPTWANFPWEFLLSGLVWSSVLNTIGCRNLISNSDPIGAPIAKSNADAKAKLHGFIAQRFNNSMLYAKWIPVLGATSTAEVMVADKLRGEYKDLKRYALRYGFFLGFDLLNHIPKRIFIFDPLFLKAFPWMEGVVNQLVKNGAAAKVINGAWELGARQVIRYGDQKIFLAADQFYKSGFKFKSSEAASSSVSNSASRVTLTNEQLSEILREDWPSSGEH